MLLKEPLLNYGIPKGNMYTNALLPKLVKTTIIICC